MSVTVMKTYQAPPVCEREILRYAGCKTTEKATLTLLRECMAEAENAFVYRVCYTELPITRYENTCDFGVFCLHSESLLKNLDGCEKVIVFAASVGIGIDRLIAKYGRISPSKAVMLQAIGTERIEALCDAFCKDIEREKKVKTKPRFSAGYGDLPLEAQKEIFAVLDCEKKIGVCLNESFLMSPSKSVTAFVGLSENALEKTEKCIRCDKEDCAFRSGI